MYLMTSKSRNDGTWTFSDAGSLLKFKRRSGGGDEEKWCEGGKEVKATDSLCVQTVPFELIRGCKGDENR